MRILTIISFTIMANLKTLLDKRRAKNDGTFNIIFRITDFKKVYTINSGISITENYWNLSQAEVDKSHPNSKLLNLKLLKDYFQIQEGILNLDDDFTIEKLRILIDGKPNAEDSSSFKLFADKLISQMIEVKRIGNAIVYQTAVNRFLEFCNKPEINFNEIDYVLLDKFSHELSLQGLKQNSISNYFRSLRAIYNKGIKEKIIERSCYPFYDIKIKTEKTLKRAVLRADIKKLEQLALDDNSQSWKALNSFLLSFYLIGISFTDLAYLKKDNIIEGRIFYVRRKTKKNYNIKILPEAQRILDKFYAPESNYLIPIIPRDVPEDTIKAKKIIQQWIKTTNKHLNELSQVVGINSKLTTYVSRHTFATTAKKLGYSNELIAEAMGHEYGNKITNIYLDSFDKEVVDAMQFKVISY